MSESIDSDNIAIVGHSDGGYTALAAAGGVADTTHIIELCLSNPQISEPFCGMVKDNKIKAEKDNVLTELHQSEVIARNYNRQELLTYCTIPNAGHYSFITPFPEVMKSELGVVAEDPAGFDRNSFHRLLSSDIVSFLDGALNTNHNKKVQPTSCLGG